MPPEVVRVFVILAVYIAAVLTVGLLANRKAEGSPEDYFLAGRKLGTLVLFMALFGTNATAFVLIGIPGKAYHDGIGVFGLNAPVVALFTPLTFFLVGVPARRMAARLGAITPAELFAERFKSPAVGVVLFLLFTIYTVPYMVTGVIGSSLVLEQVTEGRITSSVGALGVLVIALVYTTLGGMRATAWTNVLQGVIFLLFLLVAVVGIAISLGGPTAAMNEVAARDPDLLRVAREGAFEPRRWASWGLLISLTVIAFPHMFVRLLAAGSSESLRTVCRLYPLALIALWLPPVLIGVWGAAEFPGLEGRASDQIFSKMVSAHLPELLAGFGFLAVLAAVMSTLDAQLLTLSSMLVRDVVDRIRPAEGPKRDVLIGRMFAVAIAAVVYWLAVSLQDSVFGIAAVSFSGYVTLTPVLFLGVRWRRFTGAGAIASMVVGTAVLWGIWPTAVGGFLPVVWAFLSALVAGIVVSVLRPADPSIAERAFGAERSA